MSKIERINELLHKKLAQSISRSGIASDFLITVSYFEISPDLKKAKVGISVLPERFSGTALRELKKNTHIFSGFLSKETKMRKIPKISWEIDPTEKNAEDLEKIFSELAKQAED